MNVSEKVSTVLGYVVNLAEAIKMGGRGHVAPPKMLFTLDDFVTAFVVFNKIAV